MNLLDRKVIAFASHALNPGDIDGLDQPAIAMTSPQISGEKGDGLLTMGEILGLDMSADWVALSACNTGSGEGKGAEAISGLGKPIFVLGKEVDLLRTSIAVRTI